MVLLAAYLDHVAAALSAQDGARLARLVSLSKPAIQVELSTLSASNIQQICQTKLARFDTYRDVVQSLVQARKCIELQQFGEAYTAQIAAVIKFMELFRSETNWIVPFLHVLMLDTRLVAMRSDVEASEKAHDEVHDNLRNAEQHLKKGFSTSANDRAPAEHNKKLGALFIVNQLFKIYFKLNMIHLCRNLIRAVEGPAFPEFERFAKSDKVTYKYYVGRIAMFEDQYRKAEEHLEYAWKHCHRDSLRNKRMILRFLIPVKLLLGVMPSPALISAYDLPAYTGLTQAICDGNLRSFSEFLETYQDQFIQQGVYLLIEKLRLLVQRNLFKKIQLIRQNHQLRFADFQTAIESVTGQPTEMAEIECILANLISLGFIKGYMSHQKATLVVSKLKPFPAITEVHE